MQPIFPYEGTRKTPAPLTNTATEGLSSTDAVLTLRDRATGTLYDLTFGAFIEFNTPSTSGNPSLNGLIISGGWVIYIQDGQMQFDQNLAFANLANWTKPDALWISDGQLNYEQFVAPVIPP
jgi:hypothetical protein